MTERLKGWILLQVEQHGEAWYVDPISSQRYYLKDGPAAYQSLREFGLGITNEQISLIPIGVEARFNEVDGDNDGLPDRVEYAMFDSPGASDTDGDGVNDGDEVLIYHTNPRGPDALIFDEALTKRLEGRILIQVESRGEAWYVNPDDGKRYYMQDGEMAYQMMRYFGLGITDEDLVQIPIYQSDPLPSTNSETLPGDDSDFDGIPDEIDIYPNGDTVNISVDFDIMAFTNDYLDVTYHKFQIDIPYDRYNMYVQYLPHTLSDQYSNLSDYVTPNDPVILELAGKLNNYIYADQVSLYQVVGQLLYMSDIDLGVPEYPKYPVETLLDQAGDCEDTAFLLASILKAAGKDVVLIRFPDHLAVGVAMTDAEIKYMDDFITDTNSAFVEEWDNLFPYGKISNGTPGVQYIYYHWGLFNPLSYYEVDGKKYVYLESTSSNVYLDMGQIPDVYQGVDAYIHSL